MRFLNSINYIKKLRSKDPVYNCVVYVNQGCAHVDGMVCDFDKCDIRLRFERHLKNIEG